MNKFLGIRIFYLEISFQDYDVSKLRNHNQKKTNLVGCFKHFQLFFEYNSFMLPYFWLIS